MKAVSRTVCSMNILGVESSAAATPVGVDEPLRLSEWVQRFHWALLASMALVAMLYGRILKELVSDWLADSNYSHGFLVPVVFGWLLWQRRKDLAETNMAPVTWGLLIVVAAVLQLMVGQLASEYFLQRTSLLVLLIGGMLFLVGMDGLRKVLFPVGWLVFMIPLPAIIFYAVTFPLQLLASQMASGLLDLLRVPNVREGNILYLANFTVGVVEACSGIRSLISLLAFAVLLGHIRSMGWKRRWLLSISAVPVALCLNAVRVVGTGVAGNLWGAQWAEGFFHAFSGWLLFLGSLAAVFAIAEILTRWPVGRVVEGKR